MKLSIITCTYNSEKYLQDCINSVISQNLNKDTYEHIFVDGYSTDNTKRIIEKYKKDFSNVKIIERKPKGVYNAMNEGIKEARGEYIMCLNSDDWLDPNVLKSYINFIRETKENDLYYGDIRFHNGKNSFTTERFKTIKKILFKISGYQFLIFHPTVLIKKTTFMDLGMFDESKKIASDYGMRLNILKNNKGYIYYHKIITNFRIHNGSLSSNKKNHEISKKECLYFQEKYLPRYKRIIFRIVSVII